MPMLKYAFYSLVLNNMVYLTINESGGVKKLDTQEKYLGNAGKHFCANARHFVHQVDLVRTQVSSEPRFWTHAHALQLFIMQKTLL